MSSNDGLYVSLVENLAEYALFALSPGGTIISWNTGAARMFGYTKEQILNSPFDRLFTPEDMAAGSPQSDLADLWCGTNVGIDRWHVRKDRTRFWAKTSMAPIHDGAAAPIGIGICMADMTETFHSRQAQRASEDRLRRAIDTALEPAVFSLAPDGSIAGWTAAAHNIFGYAEDEIVGRQFAALFAAEDIANDVPAIVLNRATALESANAVDEERWFVRKDGSRFIGREKLSRSSAGPDGFWHGVVQIAHDVHERYEMNAELCRRASIDELTQLANRSTFYAHVQRAIATIKRRPQHLFAVLFIDLDHFKAINDTLGHIAADRLLGLTARRLEECVRSEDIVARLGGDEFAILLNGITDIGAATEAADRISTEMRKPLPVEKRDVRATVSVGIALGNAFYDRPEDILRDADMAMYAAKADGRGRSMVFTGNVMSGHL